MQTHILSEGFRHGPSPTTKGGNQPLQRGPSSEPQIHCIQLLNTTTATHPSNPHISHISVNITTSDVGA